MQHEEQKRPVQGTREWAVATVDCCIGCPHGCRYCYARYKQVDRLHLVTEIEWQHSRIIDSAVMAEYPLYDGQVMFPAHHDIVPENLDACITVLRSLLEAGNRVLVVSKPHFDCINALIRNFKPYRRKLLFRLTITARASRLLSFWEPEAPPYSERIASLICLFSNGFQTSVSIEPMLDRSDVVAMVDELLPYVTDSIWIGKMNKLQERVKSEGEESGRFIQLIEEGQRDESITALYNELKDVSKIRWKESIKDVVGLPRAEEYGLDK